MEPMKRGVTPQWGAAEDNAGFKRADFLKY